MSHITIRGGKPLRGEITVQGAKNSVLPILAAALLAGDVCRIQGCPHLSDVDSACDILRYLGCRAQWDGGDLLVDSAALTRCDIPQSLMRRMRSSVIFLGAILARCGWAELSYPGGCELGPRPIDLHLAALRALGASIEENGGKLYCRGRRLTGCEIVLASPSVGATENAMLAAVTTALQQAGCRLDCTADTIHLTSEGRLQALSPLRTAPYPGVPTDCQAIFMAALLQSRGATVFVENMFQSRYRHVPELIRMGADIRTESRVAVVCGVEQLHGADTVATDLRGGAALAVAGLAAQGITTIQGVHHIRRGYENLPGDLAALGADITDTIDAA